MILDRIIEFKKEEVCRKKKEIPLNALIRESSEERQVLNFKEALTSGPEGKNRIIAEVKKASPSKGIICENFDPVKTALQYEQNGASAVSVLTDEEFFMGSLKYLQQIKDAGGSLPLLRKDFVVDPYQIYESACNGADAILLIVAVLSDVSILKDYIDLARELSLGVLVEVHEMDELTTALKANTDIIGINNRNLKTFNTDITTTIELLKHIPEGCTVISESGIKSITEINRLKAAGVTAFLIGETFMRSEEPGQMLASFVSGS